MAEKLDVDGENAPSFQRYSVRVIREYDQTLPVHRLNIWSTSAVAGAANAEAAGPCLGGSW